MADRNDGGPAFPCMAPDNIHPAATTGMTLRDWFAGQALQSMMLTMVLDPEHAVAVMELAKEQDISPTEKVAETAYNFADAMLTERAKARGETDTGEV